MRTFPEINAKIREFVAQNFVLGRRLELADDESLMDAGIVDSTGVLELTEFLSTEFGIEIPDGDLVPENLDTIAAIVGYVDRKLVARGAAE